MCFGICKNLLGREWEDLQRICKEGPIMRGKGPLAWPGGARGRGRSRESAGRCRLRLVNLRILNTTQNISLPSKFAGPLHYPKHILRRKSEPLCRTPRRSPNIKRTTPLTLARCAGRRATTAGTSRLHVIGVVAASSVVLKLNDLFVGKDNLNDLFMGGQFQHFFGIRNIHFSRNSEPWMSPG